MRSARRPPAGWYADVQRPGHQRWWDGERWTDQRRAVYPSTPEPTPRGWRPNLGFLVVAGIAAVIILGVIQTFGGGDGGGGSDTPDVFTPSVGDAQVMCKDFIKGQLKAPATADFSDETTTGSGNRWSSSGNVDSENSFGAKIRGRYSCELRYLPASDTWRLLDSSLD